MRGRSGWRGKGLASRGKLQPENLPPRCVKAFRWVLIRDQPGVQSAERNLTRSDAEVQDSGASCIFGEVESDAEVQATKQRRWGCRIQSA